MSNTTNNTPKTPALLVDDEMVQHLLQFADETGQDTLVTRITKKTLGQITQDIHDDYMAFCGCARRDWRERYKCRVFVNLSILWSKYGRDVLPCEPSATNFDLD